MQRSLTLQLLPGTFAVCRLSDQESVAQWNVAGAAFFSVTRTGDELSVVCPDAAVPAGVQAEPGWRIFKLEGPFAFSETGILLSVIRPLAEAGIGIFALSTFDTDYVMVKQEFAAGTAAALTSAGHQVKSD